MAGEEDEDDEDWRLRGWEGWEGRRVPGRWVGRMRWRMGDGGGWEGGLGGWSGAVMRDVEAGY